MKDESMKIDELGVLIGPTSLVSNLADLDADVTVIYSIDTTSG